MKKNEENNYKVDLEDVMQRYNVPENLRDEIDARVKRINRKSSISKRVLDRRCHSIQSAYAFIRKLDLNQIREFDKLVNKANKILKQHSSISKEFKKINSEIDEFCLKIGAAKRVSPYFGKTFTDYIIPKDALLIVITSFQFN